MPVPDYQTLMRPVLEAFAEGAEKVAEVVPIVSAKVGLTTEDASERLANGRQTVLENRVHWARITLSRAGCLFSPSHKRHHVTERGRQLLAEGERRITLDRLKDFHDFSESLTSAARRAERTKQQCGELHDDETPDDAIQRLHAQIEETLAGELLDAVRGLSPTRFEQLIVDLLVAMGYGGGAPGMARSIGKSGDGGIDGVIDEDALGLDAVYVQAKRYAADNTVGRPAVQAFVGSLTGEGATKGVFVTTSSFSQGARDYVQRVQQRIVLIDGDRLARLMIRHEVGVRARQTFVLRSVDEDYFADV